MQQLYFRLIVIAAMVMGVQACDQVGKSVKDTYDPPAEKAKKTAEEEEKQARQAPKPAPRPKPPVVEEPVKEPEPVNIFETEARLDSVQQVLMQLPRFKGKRLHFLNNIYFYSPGRILLELQDPLQPEHIDSYEYEDGAWQEPKPVKLRGNRNLTNYLMPLDKIRFGTVRKILQTSRQKARELNEPEPDGYVRFINSYTFGRREWLTSISGQRHDYTLLFTMNGQLKQVRKD
ncbi:hypothetical protein [Niabella beijingensis]|uniref:hypothetical protein n=1 Tax=Niabella beijingensis TaxID=2872700 RepID=UPI001CBCCD1B|nr:hypothetical protein [Niabella beijingensis]MBZ4192670.1 hypothetical protein [Niabella beijingensis]